MRPVVSSMVPEFVAVVNEVDKMSENKSVKMAFDCAGGDFERAGEASSKIKKMLQRLGIPADCVRRIAIGTYEAEMNVIIHAGGGNVAAEVFPALALAEIIGKFFIVLRTERLSVTAQNVLPSHIAETDNAGTYV